MLRGAGMVSIGLLVSACDVGGTPKSATPGLGVEQTGAIDDVARGAKETYADGRVDSDCFNVDRAEPKELSGKLAYVMFAGPPNYEDVQKGDMPEPAYILKLSRKICITDDGGMADRDNLFDEVHLVSGKNNELDLRKLVGRSVTVGLYDQLSAHTGHHHRPLVAWVSEVSPLQESINISSSQDDPTVDYGTPATTIRAFYSALQSGEGTIAARMVVPEKITTGSFSPRELTRYYGNMRSPIELLSLEAKGDGSYVAHYKFAVSKQICNGRAVINMTERDGRNYIERIRALDGC